MGGQTVVGASFRPETKGPDFALAASIENTQMPALNPLLRAYGKVDVVGGFFSVYTEMRVKNRAVQGYVKPLIRELDVYDARQDREKNLFQQLYEAVAGGISTVLENMPRDEVATQGGHRRPARQPAGQHLAGRGDADPECLLQGHSAGVRARARPWRPRAIRAERTARGPLSRDARTGSAPRLARDAMADHGREVDEQRVGAPRTGG